jgi:general secretion pathway protein E
MRIDEELRELILRTNSAPQLRNKAREKGMHTLAEDGWRLVSLGITSFDEVLRVSKLDSGLNGDGALKEGSARV